MLSLLLGFAQALRETKAQQSSYKVPESLAPFVSKDPRYIKVYRPKESVTAVTNGEGVTKFYIESPYMYLYLNNALTKSPLLRQICKNALSIVPPPPSAEALRALLGFSDDYISSVNKGRGIVVRVSIKGGSATIWAQ